MRKMRKSFDYILVEKGELKVKIESSHYGDIFLATSNGHQWTGIDITPEKAEIFIQVLQRYLEGVEDE